MAERNKLPASLKRDVLTESGYRCAVPTCRTILAIDLHHINEVSEGGGDELGNLIALCPTCHALYHRGTYSKESMYAWKGILVSLTRAFDINAIDDLLFISKLKPGQLPVSNDGVLKFSRLIAADLVEFTLCARNGPFFLYEINLTVLGQSFIDAWKKGDRDTVAKVLSFDKKKDEL